MTESIENFSYREIPIFFLHLFGWGFFFEYEGYFYYAFYFELEQAKNGAKRQIDNLFLKKELYE